MQHSLYTPPLNGDLSIGPSSLHLPIPSSQPKSCQRRPGTQAILLEDISQQQKQSPPRSADRCMALHVVRLSSPHMTTMSTIPTSHQHRLSLTTTPKAFKLPSNRRGAHSALFHLFPQTFRDCLKTTWAASGPGKLVRFQGPRTRLRRHQSGNIPMMSSLGYTIQNFSTCRLCSLPSQLTRHPLSSLVHWNFLTILVAQKPANNLNG